MGSSQKLYAQGLLQEPVGLEEAVGPGSDPVICKTSPGLGKRSLLL